MKRKHRIVVEITFEAPCTAKEAIWALEGIIDDGIPTARNSAVFYQLPFNRVVRYALKQGERVLDAALRRARREGAH